MLITKKIDAYECDNPKCRKVVVLRLGKPLPDKCPRCRRVAQPSVNPVGRPPKQPVALMEEW
jgi:hypothetical protein